MRAFNWPNWFAYSDACHHSKHSSPNDTCCRAWHGRPMHKRSQIFYKDAP